MNGEARALIEEIDRMLQIKAPAEMRDRLETLRRQLEEVERTGRFGSQERTDDLPAV